MSALALAELVEKARAGVRRQREEDGLVYDAIEAGFQKVEHDLRFLRPVHALVALQAVCDLEYWLTGDCAFAGEITDILEDEAAKRLR